MKNELIKKGLILKDEDGKACIITDITSNSIEVYIEKKTEKGVNAKHWFTEKEFSDRFKII